MAHKETEEALVALVKLGKFVAAQAKDGLDIKDAGALATKIIGDETFRAALVAGFEGAAQIPSELQHFSFEDGISLALALVNELKA